MTNSKFLRFCFAALVVQVFSGCAAPPSVAQGGEKPVMIYDTATGRMVSNEVYHLRQP